MHLPGYRNETTVDIETLVLDAGFEDDDPSEVGTPFDDLDGVTARVKRGLPTDSQAGRLKRVLGVKPGVKIQSATFTPTDDAEYSISYEAPTGRWHSFTIRHGDLDAKALRRELGNTEWALAARSDDLEDIIRTTDDDMKNVFNVRPKQMSPVDLVLYIGGTDATNLGLQRLEDEVPYETEYDKPIALERVLDLPEVGDLKTLAGVESLTAELSSVSRAGNLRIRIPEFDDFTKGIEYLERRPRRNSVLELKLPWETLLAQGVESTSAVLDAATQEFKGYLDDITQTNVELRTVLPGKIFTAGLPPITKTWGELATGQSRAQRVLQRLLRRDRAKVENAVFTPLPGAKFPIGGTGAYDLFKFTLSASDFGTVTQTLDVVHRALKNVPLAPVPGPQGVKITSRRQKNILDVRPKEERAVDLLLAPEVVVRLQKEVFYETPVDKDYALKQASRDPVVTSLRTLAGVAGGNLQLSEVHADRLVVKSAPLAAVGRHITPRESGFDYTPLARVTVTGWQSLETRVYPRTPDRTLRSLTFNEAPYGGDVRVAPERGSLEFLRRSPGAPDQWLPVSALGLADHGPDLEFRVRGERERRVTLIDVPLDRQWDDAWISEEARLRDLFNGHARVARVDDGFMPAWRPQDRVWAPGVRYIMLFAVPRSMAELRRALPSSVVVNRQRRYVWAAAARDLGLVTMDTAAETAAGAGGGPYPPGAEANLSPSDWGRLNRAFRGDRRRIGNYLRTMVTKHAVRDPLTYATQRDARTGELEVDWTRLRGDLLSRP